MEGLKMKFLAICCYQSYYLMTPSNCESYGKVHKSLLATIFRIQSTIFDGAFCENSSRLKDINSFWKNLHVRCSTKFEYANISCVRF